MHAKLIIKIRNGSKLRSPKSFRYRSPKHLRWETRFVSRIGGHW